jgi:hypothetical protein
METEGSQSRSLGLGTKSHPEPAESRLHFHGNIP